MISKLICALFGHAPLTNVLGRTGYADVCGAAFDGIGRGHLYLTADCPRCGATYSICNVHAYAEPPLTKPEVQPAPSVPSVEAAELMGAKGGSAVDAERLAFEAWMRGHCWKLGAKWTGTEYRSAFEKDGMVDMHAMRTRELWAAWRDRAALAASPATKP